MPFSTKTEPARLSLSPEQEAFLLEFEVPKSCFLVTIWLEGVLAPAFLKTLFEAKKAAVENAKNGHPDELHRAEYLAERTHFLQIAKAIEAAKTGSDFLWQTEPRRIAEEKLKEMDGHFFRLHAYSILPNAVHFLVDFETQLAQNQAFMHQKAVGLLPVLRLYKGGSGRTLANLAHLPDLKFWAMLHAERRIEQTDHFFAAVDFVLQSSVRTGLCENWREHDGSWTEPLYLLGA